MEFKNKALDKLVSEMNKTVGELPSYERSLIEYAFNIGFKSGVCNQFSESTKEYFLCTIRA